MKLLLKNVTLLDETSEFHNQTVDIAIENGKISAIGDALDRAGFDEISADGLHASPGWFDSSVSFGEPGYEDRETIENGLSVAAKSGFTAVALQPNSNPVIDNASPLQLVLSKASGKLTELFPIGALTRESHGKDLAELFEMKQMGAVAFGDYTKYIENANLFKIALQYLKDFDGLLLAFSQEKSMTGNGIAHEGTVSTRLGMKGIPALAEELAVARNLQLLEYTGGRLHIPTISTAKSVALIKEAKTRGLNVTCSVSVHHLVLIDADLETFDSRRKVSPPIRSEEHRKALLKGVKDGTIDCITSDHNPIDIEQKKLEFDLAKDGTIGLESAFPALLTVLPADIICKKLAAGRRIFHLSEPKIEVGEMANLTLFSTEGNWNFTKENILSKSKNSAFLGKKMKGKVIGTIRGEKTQWA